MDSSLRVQVEAVETLKGPALLGALLRLAAADRDAFVDETFGFTGDAPDVDLPPGAVPYLPCGVDEILAFTAEVPLGPADTFVDLGSGLGRVAILVHLLTGATARGVEIQTALVERARLTAEAIGVPVVFDAADVTQTALEGTVFFLYAPFNGPMRVRAIERLRAVAERHPIVVATVDLALNDVRWLRARPSTHPALAVYDSELQQGRADVVGRRG